jgi:hypothetical protein
MENRIAVNIQDVINNQKIIALFKLGRTSNYFIENNPVYEILTAEGGEKFYNYIDWLGLVKDPNLVVLSSLHNYYYDAEEMNNVKTVVNLIELNHLKHIKRLLHSIFHTMPQKSNFIGCFIDNEKINGYVLRNNSSSYHTKRSIDSIENGIVSQNPFINMLYCIMDSKTINYMSKRSVYLLLKSHGFKIMDMTELNGLTYFHSQKIRSDYN